MDSGVTVTRVDWEDKSQGQLGIEPASGLPMDDGGTQILSLFECFDAPDVRKASCALASVLQAWAPGNTSDEGSELPVLLENRIDVLQQAISRDEPIVDLLGAAVVSHGCGVSL